MAIRRVAFRTDASLEIGTGHVMRCLTLAQALRDKGAQCTFICREHVGHLNESIRAQGFVVKVLPASQLTGGGMHAHWLGVTQEQDVRDTYGVIAQESFDWLVVDHYAIDAQWESQCRSLAKRLMVIDDLADRVHDCDLLLDQNLGRDPADCRDRVGPDCQLIVGPRYALLRSEFLQLRAQSLARRSNPVLQDWLITMGGVDAHDWSGQVLQALQALALDSPQLLGTRTRVTVVLGPSAPHHDRVRELASQMPWPTRVLIDVQNMAELMRDSDIAIGAAGSTSWERCALGLPSLVLVTANNQKVVALALQKLGVSVVLDEHDLKNSLGRYIDQIHKTPTVLSRLSIAAARVTDAAGAVHVAACLESYPDAA